MHKLFAPILAIAVLLAVLAPVPGHATGADNKGIKLDFDAAVLQRMSAFVSAFAEVDPQGRWHQIDDASQADAKFLINFGVLHNWMHNASAFAVDGGQASIDAAVVAATIEEYTGLKFDSHAAVPESGISFADGRYAVAADTPREGPQAVVANVYVTPDNQLVMCGHVADKRPEDGHDDLQVRVAHHTWKGKDCWKLLTWAWTGKPEVKPAEKVVEQPAVQPVEQAVEQPVPQPAEQQAGQGTEQTAEQPKAESAPEAQPEPVAEPAAQPATEVAPIVEPAPVAAPADKSAAEPEAQPATETAPAPQSEAQSVPEAKPEPQGEPATAPIAVPEAQPAAESQPAAEPATAPAVQPLEQSPEAPTSQPAVQPKAQPAEQPAEQAAPESAPATPAETDNAPAAAPETQAEPEVAPEAQPAPEAVPAPQPDVEPVAETVIPFTASTEPDFSEVLAIAVPTGWNHRNAQGVLELTPEAEDAWLVVEAVRLGARDPQKALKLFSGGAALTPFGTGGASYIFTSEGRNGHREHMIVVDADANLICRLTWQASEAHRDAIEAILHGLRVNGRAVAG